MTRLCECGCQQEVEGRARFIDAKHRARKWRADHVTAGPTGPGPRSGRNARSGSQISYRKAVEVLEVWLRTQMGETPVGARREAELVLRGALSDRQAERERQRERA